MDPIMTKHSLVVYAGLTTYAHCLKFKRTWQNSDPHIEIKLLIGGRLYVPIIFQAQPEIHTKRITWTERKLVCITYNIIGLAFFLECYNQGLFVQK